MSEQQGTQGTWADLASPSQDAQGTQGSWADLQPSQPVQPMTPAQIALQVAKTKAGLASQANLQPKSALQSFLPELLKRTQEVGKPFSDALDAVSAPMNAIDNAVNSVIPPTVRGMLTGPSEIMAGASTNIPVSQYAMMAAPGLAKAASNAVTNKFGLTPTQQIENAIAPGAVERRAITNNIAPELAKDANLTGKTGAAFDQALFSRYQTAQKALDAAEKSVPAGTMVPKQPLLQQVDKAIDDLQVSGQNGAKISGHDDAVKILQQERDKLDQFGDQIPFSDLLKYRRQLDQAIRTSGGFKETASAADRAAMEAKRLVANTVRGGLANSTGAMSAANKEYGLMRNAIDAAGLDDETGRRLATVGKATSPLEAAKAAALRYLPPALLGAAGAKAIDIYRQLNK